MSSDQTCRFGNKEELKLKRILCTMTLLMAGLAAACTRPQAKPPSAQAAPQPGSTAQASGGSETGSSAQPSGQGKVFSGEGVVEGVDRSIDTIQINHGDIKGYMPAMSMPYRVKDKSMLDLVKPGDKVTFTLEDKTGGAVLIEIKKAGT